MATAIAADRLHATKNSLPEGVRQQMSELLQARLADALDLQLQAKQAHWNVKGPSFIALHELFDKAVDEIREYSDETAERLVQLGGVAEGTVQAVNGRTSLAPYPLDISAGRDHVEAFSSALSSYGEATRRAIDAAAGAGDQATADIFTEITRGVDKLLYFVESHNL